MATYTPRLCIIDDDPIFATVLKAQIESQFPNLYIDQFQEPVITPEYNIYCIDNDFEGKKISRVLLQRIRSLNPNALVIACSSTLDSSTLKHLMNGGCNAVYDKNVPDDSQEAFEVIRNYLSVLENHVAKNRGKPIYTIIQSIQSLLTEWNSRLAKEL